MLARGARAGEPLDRLTGDLSKTDLIVLSGFSREDLAGAREAALARFVAGGGAILFAGGLPRLSRLPLPQMQVEAEESGNLPSRITGTFGERTMTFQGFPSWKDGAALGGRRPGAPRRQTVDSRTGSRKGKDRRRHGA